MLRSLIVFLIVLNLGAGAWWLVRDRMPPASGQASPLPPGVAPLRMVGEPEASGPAHAPAAGPAEQCVRLGPFVDVQARGHARAALDGLVASLVDRDLPALPGRGWRVMLPPQASHEDAVAMAERIRAAGIGDLFVVNQGEEANAIALGRFGNEEGARRREAELRGKGFSPQVERLGVAQLWLDARVPPAADLVALSRIAPARVLDCAGLQ